MLDLNELERLGKSATEPRWTTMAGDKMFIEPPGKRARWEDITSEDATFIQAARNNWQEMIDEIRRLQLDLDDAREAARHMVNFIEDMGSYKESLAKWPWL